MRKQIKAYIVHFPSFFSFFLSNSVLFCHFAFGSLHSLSFLVLSDPVHPHLLLPFISLPIILLPTSFLSHFSFVVFSYPILYCTVISLSFHFLSFLVLPCPTLSFPFISFSVLYYPVPFCTIISFPCLSFPISSRLFLPFIVQSCPFLYCPFLSCLFFPPPPFPFLYCPICLIIHKRTTLVLTVSQHCVPSPRFTDVPPPPRRLSMCSFAH